MNIIPGTLLPARASAGDAFLHLPNVQLGWGMGKSRTLRAPFTDEALCTLPAKRSGMPGKHQQINSRIRTLEDQNEKLAACAARISTEIGELKSIINRRH
jgi:hypothetical protein